MASDWTPDAPLVVGDLSLEILCVCVRDAAAVLSYRPWMVFSAIAGKAVACTDIVHGAPGPEDAAAARLACLRAAEGVLRQRAEEAERGLAEVRRRMRAEGRGRVVWEQQDERTWDARWGVPPMVLTLSVWQHGDGTHRAKVYYVRDDTMYGVWDGGWWPTLAEAQDACEAWLDDWLRRSGGEGGGK